MAQAESAPHDRRRDGACNRKHGTWMHTPEKGTAPEAAAQESPMVECPGLADEPAGLSDVSYGCSAWTPHPPRVVNDAVWLWAEPEKRWADAS